MLSKFGTLYPLIIPSDGTGLMNPSIYNDNDKLICNIRHVNYSFYHSEKNKFHHYYGPLQYLHPENDKSLRTKNYLCELNDDLSISSFNLVNTSKLDKPPAWGFIGLEDARIVRWDNKLYYTGVRRDTTPDGQGRMELSEIENNEEITRIRIPSLNEEEYCEKNWMPILDLPYTYVRWSSPITEIVKYDLGETKIVCLNEQKVKNVLFRGGSQVIPFIYNKKKYYFAIVHSISISNSELSQKNGYYRHHILIWTEDFKLIKYTAPFTFMNSEIEFCCGACIHKDRVIISFGFQDNAAFLLSFNEQSFFNMVFSI